MNRCAQDIRATERMEQAMTESTAMKDKIFTRKSIGIMLAAFIVPILFFAGLIYIVNHPPQHVTTPAPTGIPRSE